MAETDFAVFESKNERDRTFMYILYGLHTIAWASFGSLAVIALVLNYVKRSDEQDAVYASHHNYMISTFWWTLVWLVLTSPLYLAFFVPGLVAWTIVGLWYLYRCLRGIVKFADNRPPY